MKCNKCGYDAPFLWLWYCYTCNQQKEFAKKDVSKLIKKQKNNDREQRTYWFVPEQEETHWQKESRKPLKDTIILDWLEDYLKGEKESTWKLSYELHRPFITAMAKSMSQNKWKYPPSNRQKPMHVEELKQALFRHTIEVMNWNYTDNDELDHLSAIACNAQFIYYQLSNHAINNPMNTPRG